MKISWGSKDAGIRKNGFIKGLFLGLIVLTCYIGSFYYIINMEKQSPALIIIGSNLLVYLIPLLTIILLVFYERKKNSGFLTFKQIVTLVFIMTLTCYAILLLGRNLLFINFVEPDMNLKTMSVMRDSRIAKEKADGVSAQNISKDLVERKEDYTTQGENDRLSIFENILDNILMFFVLSIILAAIFKKDPPSAVIE